MEPANRNLDQFIKPEQLIQNSGLFIQEQLFEEKDNILFSTLEELVPHEENLSLEKGRVGMARRKPASKP